MICEATFAAVGKLLELSAAAASLGAPTACLPARSAPAAGSAIDRSSSAPVSRSASTSDFAPRGAGSARHRANLDPTPRAIPHPPVRPLDERELLASARALTPCAACPESVGYFTSASITVESIRTARTRNRFSRVAFAIKARVSSSTVSGPIRRVSFLTVDSSGTRSDNAIRQNRRRWIESDTSATSVLYPHR